LDEHHPVGTAFESKSRVEQDHLASFMLGDDLVSVAGWGREDLYQHFVHGVG
jgi:hypothetical protein